MNKNNTIIIIGISILAALLLAIIFIKTPKNTLYVNNQIDSLNIVIINQKDSIQFYKSALDSSVSINNKFIHQVDSLNNTIVLYKYKLNRIKDYCDIVGRNSTQQKYLRGWINRVLED